MQRSYSDYEYFASGRKNCFYMHFKMSLKHRHCLMTTLSYDMYYGTPDTVTIEIPIDLPRDLQMEFMMVRKKDMKAKLAALPYLNDFVKSSNAKNYKLGDKIGSNNSLVILSEHDEVTN